MKKFINMILAISFMLASVAPGSIVITVLLGTFINLGFYWGSWLWIFGVPILIVVFTLVIWSFDFFYKFFENRFPKVFERAFN